MVLMDLQNKPTSGKCFVLFCFGNVSSTFKVRLELTTEIKRHRHTLLLEPARYPGEVF